MQVGLPQTVIEEARRIATAVEAAEAHAGAAAATPEARELAAGAESHHPALLCAYTMRPALHDELLDACSAVGLQTVPCKPCALSRLFLNAGLLLGSGVQCTPSRTG